MSASDAEKARWTWILLVVSVLLAAASWVYVRDLGIIDEIKRSRKWMGELEERCGSLKEDVYRKEKSGHENGLLKGLQGFGDYKAPGGKRYRMLCFFDDGPDADVRVLEGAFAVRGSLERFNRLKSNAGWIMTWLAQIDELGKAESELRDLGTRNRWLIERELWILRAPSQDPPR